MLTHVRRRRGVPALVLALLLGLLGAFLVQPTFSPTPAYAGDNKNAQHGAGYVLSGTQWVGTWKTKQGSGFCIEFNKNHPDNSTSLVKLGGGDKVPGMSAADSARVKYIANKYGNTKSNLDGAAAALVVWQIQNEKRFVSYEKWLKKHKKISKALAKRISEISAESKNYGPYKLSVTLGAGLPGQNVPISATARNAKNKPAPGLSVKLTGSNLKPAVAARTTNASGVASTTGKVLDLGRASVTATVATPSWKTVWLSKPSPGRQKLVISGPFNEIVKAMASSEKKLGDVTITSKCDSECKGVATVVVTRVVPAGSKSVLTTVSVAGGSSVTFYASAGKSSSKTLNLPDGSTLTTKYCYVDRAGGPCASKTVADPGTFEVVCPPAPTAWVKLTYCCGKVTIEGGITTPATSRYFVVRVRINDQDFGPPINLVPGKEITLPPTTVDLAKLKNLKVEVIVRAYADAAHTQPLLINGQEELWLINQTSEGGVHD